MYPRDRTEPLPEELILKGELEPTNEGYALAKIVTARLGDYLMRQDAGFQCKTLVPCNLYGRHDKFDPAHSHLVPAIIHKLHVAMQQGDDTVEIWGDGSARREFMYAGDLADALVAAIRRFDSVPAYMNVGLGHDHSINDYYHAAAEVMGYRGRFVHDTTKPVGMARKLVHVGRQTVWGWSAKHSLHEGLRLTYQFYLDQRK
jgi:GDP-L-fucose synthase